MGWSCVGGETGRPPWSRGAAGKGLSWAREGSFQHPSEGRPQGAFRQERLAAVLTQRQSQATSSGEPEGWLLLGPDKPHCAAFAWELFPAD